MAFDPYHKWLGVAPKDQPPNHYRLLAIEVFEPDPEVIDAAANRQMSYLQQRAHGKHAALSQKLLNEISAARVCLLDPKKKAKYDAELKAKLAEGGQATGSLNPDLSELESSPAGAQPMPSVLTPLRPVRTRRPFRPEPWHYAVTIGVVSLLGLGGSAVLTSGGKAKQQVAVTEPERPAVPEQKEAATPPPEATQPKPSGDQEKNNPTAAEEKPPEPSSGTSEQKASTWTPPVYRLTIEPSWATLEVYDKATVTGSGRERQLRVDNRPDGGTLLVVLTCDGYESKREWLTPESGKDHDIAISLSEKSVRSTSETSDETSRTRGATTDGSIQGFHGITHYDKATGIGSFTYNFNDPSELRDFGVENPAGATVSDGWLRLSGQNQMATHEARFHSVRVQGEADISLNERPFIDLVSVTGIAAGQLWPERRALKIYVSSGKGHEFVPIPRWNSQPVSFVFDVRDHDMLFSVNGKEVRAQGEMNRSARVKLRCTGAISYRKLQIEGRIDPAWLERFLSRVSR